MRQIKFRVWDNEDYMSEPFTLQDLQGGKIKFTSDCVVMQFTGLQDKNGVDIYEGDIVNYGYFAFNDSETFGKEPWKNLPDDVDENELTRIKDKFEVIWEFSFLNDLEYMIEHNPDIVGVEIIGNIHTKPELLK